MSNLKINVPYGITHIRFDNLTELQFKVLQSLIDNQVQNSTRRSAQMPFTTLDDKAATRIVIYEGRASGKMTAIQNALSVMKHKDIALIAPHDDINFVNLNISRPPIIQQNETPLDRIQDGRAD